MLRSIHMLTVHYSPTIANTEERFLQGEVKTWNHKNKKNMYLFHLNVFKVFSEHLMITKWKYIQETA